MQSVDTKGLKKIVFSLIEKYLNIFCTTKTINVSNGEKNFALESKLGKDKKFVVIYNGIETNTVDLNRNKLRQINGFGENDFIIGTTARLDDQKDPWTFYKISKEICQSYENAVFVYIGEGKFKEDIQKEIDKSNLNSKINLMGFRSDADEIIYMFDAYIITSLYEGLPYSLVEALKARLPIIATDVIGNNEIVSHQYNGLLFEKRNIEMGVSRIKDILEGKFDLNKMGENSFKVFEEKFTLDGMIKSTMELYDL